MIQDAPNGFSSQRIDLFLCQMKVMLSAFLLLTLKKRSCSIWECIHGCCARSSQSEGGIFTMAPGRLLWWFWTGWSFYAPWQSTPCGHNIAKWHDLTKPLNVKATSQKYACLTTVHIHVSCAGTTNLISFENALSNACLPPEEEEREATYLSDKLMVYQPKKSVHGKDNSLPLGRIKLQDLNLQIASKKPVVLGKGSGGTVNFFLDWTWWLLNILSRHLTNMTLITAVTSAVKGSKQLAQSLAQLKLQPCLHKSWTWLYCRCTLASTSELNVQWKSFWDQQRVHRLVLWKR